MKHFLRMMLEKAKKAETSADPSSSHHEEPLPAEEPRASEVAGDETVPHSEVASGENQEAIRHHERSRRRKEKQKAEEEEEEEEDDKEKAPRRKKGKQMTHQEEQVQQHRLEAREVMALKIGVENPAWAVQKTLFVSDISEHQHRLQLPRLGVEGSPLLGVMTPAEMEEMYGKGAKIVVLDRLRNEYSMLFRDVGNNNGFRILGADWMNYVRRNKLEAGDSLDLWAFRRPCKDEEKTELVFVLLHHQNQNQREESEKKAKKVKAKKVSSSSSSSPRPVQASGFTAQDEADAVRGLLKFHKEYSEIQKRKSQSTDRK